MTLVLVCVDERGEIDVIADTLFGEMGRIGSEVGPKIFLVPITISDLDTGTKIALPNMGFAFAGNVLSGQFTHALASTCLQNLAAPDTTSHPDVEDIAKFYSSCAVKIHEERRRHHAIDSYGFEGVVFGYSKTHARSTAYHFAARVAADGTCEAPVKELDLEVGIPFPLGSGALAARTKIEQLVSRHIEINPFSLMDAIIRDPNVTSVGGEFQAATASLSGVELRPIMFFLPTKDGGMDADFSVMGISIHCLGMVAGYVPVGTPTMAQTPDDLTYISGIETKKYLRE